MYRGADKSLARPGRKQATATEDLASNEIFSPSHKIHRKVGRAEDLSAPWYVKLTQRRPMYLSFSSSYLQFSRCGRSMDSILLCSVHDDSGCILVCSIWESCRWITCHTCISCYLMLLLSISAEVPWSCAAQFPLLWQRLWLLGSVILFSFHLHLQYQFLHALKYLHLVTDGV